MTEIVQNIINSKTQETTIILENSKTDRNFVFKINNFDLIRFFAALQVLLQHGHVHLKVQGINRFMEMLGLFPGVPIFFFISGFLISASYERSESLFSYCKNRFLRIYPGLWACFAFSLIMIFLVYKPNIRTLDFLSWIVAQMSFMQFYNPEFLRPYGVGVLNGSLWTISVELQFYLIVPIIYFLFKKINWNIFAILSIISVFIIINQIYLYFLNKDNTLVIKMIGVTILPYLYFFLVGMLLQRYNIFIEKYLNGKLIYWFLLYILATIIINNFGLSTVGNNLNPISAVILAIFTVSCAYSYPYISNKLLRGNDISYGMYIYHMIIINMFVYYKIVDSLLILILALLFTIIMALFSWKFIEKPALSLKTYSVRYR